MKATAALPLLLLLCAAVSAAADAGANPEDGGFSRGLYAVRSYHEIPGVTDEDVAAIETIKASRGSLSYGSAMSAAAFILPDGTGAGFADRFCELLSGLFGIPFVQEFHAWDALKSGVDEHAIDFTGDLAPTSERLRQYFMTPPIAQRSLGVFFDNRSAAATRTANDLNGRRIGFYAGSTTERSVRRTYPDLAFEPVMVQNAQDMAEKLKAGAIDAGVADAADAFFADGYDFISSAEILPLVYTPVSLATANPELEPIITVMGKYIAAGGARRLHELYRQGRAAYVKFLFDRSLTGEERTYLDKLAVSGGTVPVLLENGNYPVCFYNEREGEHQGIAPDILAEISGLTGVRFEPPPGSQDMPWSEMLEALRTGKAALTTELLRSADREGEFAWADAPYASARHALLSKASFPNLEMYQVPQSRVGVVAGSAYEGMYASWFPNSANVRRYNNHTEALEALENEAIDLLMTSENILFSQTNYREKPGYKTNIVFGESLESSFGFNKNEGLLRSIVSKAQRHIDVERTVKDWKSRVFDYSRKYAVERSAYLAAFSAVLALSLAVLGVLLAKISGTRKLFREQALTLSTVYRSLPDIVVHKDANGRYKSCNYRFEEFVGHSEAEVIGKTAAEVLPDGDASGSLARLDATVLREGRTSVAEEWHEERGRNRVCFEIVKSPLVQDGKASGLLTIARDITEQKRQNHLLGTVNLLSAKLLQSDANSFERDLLQAMHMMAETVDADRTYIWKNVGEDGRARCRPAYEWPDDAESRQRRPPAAAADGGVFSEWEGQLSAGCYVTGLVRELSQGARETLSPRGVLSILVVPIFMQEKFWGFVGFDDCRREREFTANEIATASSTSLLVANAMLRHEMMQNLRATAARLETVIANYPGMIWCVDRNDAVILFNGIHLKRIGVDPGRVAGGKLAAAEGDPLLAKIITNVRETFSGGAQEWMSEIGGKIFHMRTMPVFDDGGNTVNVVGSADDITDIIQLQRKLENAIQAAKDANRAKTDFLAKMSHEMRTPMNAIIGLTELALRESDLDTVFDYARTVKQAGTSLMSIINDVLDFSRVESGRLAITPGDYSFSSLIVDVINIVRMRAVDSPIRFVANVDSNLPDALTGDEVRIRQVLINLLTNAFKYTEAGFVSLAIRGEVAGDDAVNLVMEVADSGKGIKPEDIEAIFDAYIQSDREHNRYTGGVGLGLAITKSIVQAMGGEVSVRSEYGKGSVFTVLLPQKYRSRTRLATVADPEEKDVLVYERRKVYADSITRSLDNLGVRRKLVSTDAELAEELAGKRYAFLFMPSALHEGNRETIERFGADAKYVLLAEFGELLSGKASSVLPMPTHCISIAGILNGEAGGFSGAESRKSSTARFVAPAARVLVVDDINTNLKVAEGLLRPYKMRVDLCDSGMKAMRAMQTNRYDMVFMDHKMPIMDGVEVTARIRKMGVEDEYYKNLPIVALTANAVSGFREMFLQSGFNDFLSKPIDSVKLDLLLAKWIPEDKQEGLTAGYVKENPERRRDDGPAIALEGVDVERGILFAGGEIGLYMEMLTVFCGDGRARAAEVRTCLGAGDLTLLTIHVHALKSALANIGASKLSAAAKALEEAGERGDARFVAMRTEPFLSDLEALVERTRDLLLTMHGGPGAAAGKPLDGKALDAELRELKAALEATDAGAMTRISDALRRRTLGDDIAISVNAVSDKILLAEYGEAIELIEKLLDREEKNK